MRVVFLSGGTGTPKLVEGFLHLISQEDLTVIVNTADDEELYGLYVSPDVDTVVYLFAGLLDTRKYWGIVNDTFTFMGMLKRYLGDKCWFNLGDMDLATHVFRTMLLRSGYTLTQATRMICERLGVKATVLPMTDDRVRTLLKTDRGLMTFQEFHVKYRDEPEVYEIVFEGLSEAKPAPGVLEAFESADLIVIGPSNPVNSIGPILSVKGVKEAIKASKAPVIAVSPIRSGKPFSGPADKFMRAIGVEPTSYGVAQIYRDVADVLIVDLDDTVSDEAIEGLGLRVVRACTVLDSLDRKIALARLVLSLAEEVCHAP